MGTKNSWDKDHNRNMVDLKPTISAIIYNINLLNTVIKTGTN